ncbi:hypothetical protein MRB53_030697 [Persea americana]|uniref:Uncharacterized protein n=1 Tax=Persea americana TaxID=3435 RepID=A0ACC2KML3_PERAE|nr:hypothetical protein MRB53_030697 [Persea americana]
MEESIKRDEDNSANMEETQREQQRMRITMANMMRRLSGQQNNFFEGIARGARRCNKVSVGDELNKKLKYLGINAFRYPIELPDL